MFMDFIYSPNLHNLILFSGSNILIRRSSTQILTELFWRFKSTNILIFTNPYYTEFFIDIIFLYTIY